MLFRFRLAAATVPVLCLLSLLNADAQAPVALPYTMTTIGGLSPMAATAGTQCPNLPAGVTSTDAFGDGCLAVNSVLGAVDRGGVLVDSFGNVIVGDDVNSVIHIINPATGIMSVLAGKGTACSGKLDSAGDGCLAATQTVTTSQRGIGLDPYGNVLLSGYGDGLVHIVCRTASPLCTAAQVGFMELVAGCSTGTGVSGTAGAGLDNIPAKTTSAGTCTASLGEVNTPRGVTADMYGNVYFAETATYRFRVVVGPLTSSYFSGNNPIYAALGVHYPSVIQGNAYTVVDIGGTSAPATTAATTPGSTCSETVNSVVYSGTALDALGDGCPLDFSSVSDGSTSYVQGAAVDAAGNMIFTDQTHGLRVFFVSGSGTAGAKMAGAITVNNPSVTTPQPGFVYMLAGKASGGTAYSATPTPGTSTTLADTSMFKVAVSPQGNIYVGDSTKVLFFDINTGYLRLLLTSGTNVTAGNFCTGSSGQTSLSAFSDACPASKSAFSNSNALGLAVDGQGSLYLLDGVSSASRTLIRKVLAQGFAEQTLGTPLTQTFQTHFLGANSSISTVTSSTNGNMSYGSPSCTLNADDSVDCNVAVTATPSAAGLRSASMTVSNASAAGGSGQEFTFSLGGTVIGSVLAVDSASAGGTSISPTTSAVLSGNTPASVALDGAGNVYAASGDELLESIGGTTYTLSPALQAPPNQIVVDQTGNVFAVSSGASTIEELAVTAAGTPSTYAAITVSYSNGGTPAPAAIAVDQAGNLYVADATTEAIYRLSMVANTLQAQTTIASGFIDFVSLAVDPSGNVYVADKGAGKVYELSSAVIGGQYVYSQSTKLSGVTPVALAVDAASDLYVQDGSSLSVIEVPISGPSNGVTVLSGLSIPTGLAVDGSGNVYSADSSSGITQVVRDAILYNFGTSTSTAFTATLTNVGNQASTGQNTSNPGSVPSDFNVVAGSSNGCNFSASVMGALSAGNACELSATFFGLGNGPQSDFISFLPSASTVGTLDLTGTAAAVAYPTTSTISSPSGTQVFGASPEVSFTITVAASTAPSAPIGSVNVYLDSTTVFTQYPLTAATSNTSTATVILSGLSAGSHTIAVVYPTTGSFTGSGSSSTTTAFSIAQATTSVSWTPSTASQQVSAAIGTGVLNAIASPSIAGEFVYTATPSGGSAIAIDASSYLPIGTYSLGVTFYPIDFIDYATATASVVNYAVTQATATAAVGASTNVVAADGTGNYTSLSAALAALPVTGGTIYLKPGTYTGQNAVSYPNVYLRGLGGDPTKVILTAEDGAFSAPFVYPGSGPGNANASGDQGSSTLDVTKSFYMGTTLGSTQFTPNNFFAEYLTIQNTYNTDATTTSTYTTASGTCADTGVSQTLQAIYNSGKQCSSQALALWMESDQAVLNNVNLISQQDTLYAGSQGCGALCTVARQYMWKGMITGDVDYVFGDAAMVFDHTNFFTTWHGTPTGENTIEAQDKRFQTNSSSDYLSGYICNSCTLMSQSAGMTNLYYGRPYSATNSTTYSTWIMLNTFVDQVNPAGWIEFTPGTTNYLPSATYAEYNTQTFTDPTPGTNGYPATLFGGTVTPTGANTGAGVTGARETTSTDPGTIEASNTIRTSLTVSEAAQYYPVNFLGSTISSATLSAGQPANWNPVTALANAVNSFAPAGNVSLNSNTESVTILGRPQTPGAGILPTGTYAFMDSLNGGTATTLGSGTLDASGEAYYTSSTLATGTHSITMVYGGDSNFTGSTSSAFTITVPAAPLTVTTTALTVTNTSSAYGGTITGTVTVAPSTGTVLPTGAVTLKSGATTLGTCTLSSGTCSYTLSNVAAGNQTMTASYSGDSSYAASTSSGVAFNVVRGILQVAANNLTMTLGQPVPTLTYSITGFVNQDTQTSAVTGTPLLTTTATGASIGEYPIAITTGTLAASNYTFGFTSGNLYVASTEQATPVATGDTRTVTEPAFPAVCTTLAAALTSVNDDIPASVDATVTNPDGARIQAALNSCAGTGQAVELSVDGAGHDAYLTGPLTMPSGVTLLVDPGVYVYFSRNVQDYDKIAGTHTCGTVNSNSATSSCLPLIDIPGTSTNVGIMGFGKLDGRGGDALINAFPSTFAGQSWWGLSSIANSGGSQQNPRFIQIDTGSSNITLYKITLRNSPLFHISTTGASSNFTAWDIKIVTPTSSRNTDGIDPGNAQNFTITRSWISDGDDNIAVGAAGTTAPAANISVTNNHFFAGHGESIGSYTSAGVSNILFDGNMSSGNGVAGSGSSINNTADSNSTGIRIKSGYDRGGVVTNVQYSNTCLQDHKAEIVFNPNYENTTGSETPNFNNILMQNLTFLTAGTAQFTGTSNNGTIFPLGVTLDNVSFPGTYPASEFSPAPTNAALTYGPGQVSADFASDYATFVGANGNTVMNNIAASGLQPPTCSFTYIAPELTGPNGLPQTITQGENATAVVILTPSVGGAAYPTGTVTLTDALNSSATTVTLPGATDTIFVPLTGLAPGTHTFTATYSGDSNYTLTSGQVVYSTTAPYVITVNSGSLAGTTTTLSGVPASTPFGTSFTATATVAGSSPTGAVEFIVNGSVFATSALASGTATASISLPFSTSPYSIYAVYSGDFENNGSTSSTSSVSVTAALTTTALSASATTITLGHPIVLTAIVTSSVGSPTGTVTFTYTTTGSSTPVPISATLIAGSIVDTALATAGVTLPIGTDSVTATYAASGSFAGSASAPMSFTVTVGTILALPSNPITLPYSMTTIAGGATANCASAADNFGDGCPSTSMVFGGSVDLRSVVADPFGNVYLTDAVSSLVRRIAPNGVISDFAGRVTGTACVPTATIGCTPTLVSLNKPRGISSDAQGNIFIAGYNSHEVFKVSVSNGLLYLVAGTGSAGSTGDGGLATSAQVNAPRGVWADTIGNIYIADTSNNKIRIVDVTGNIHTFAGTGTAASNGDGGLATSAAINNPQGVMTDANLNVYIADSAKVRVVCVTCGTGSPLDALLERLGITSPQNGFIYTLAGGASASYSGAYPTLATNITMSPQKLAIDGNSDLYISDGGGAVWFIDSHTANIRPIAGKQTTNCAGETDNFGDGCPATQAVIGDGGNGIGVGTDTLGNLYISDTLNARIRKVTTGLASPATATGSAATQPVELHFIPSDGPASSNALVLASTEWSLGIPACITNSDSTTDCLLTSSFTPAVPGARSTPLTVNSTLGNTANLGLTGVGSGAGSTLDPASQSNFGTNLQVIGLATDNAGNVYVADAISKQLLRFASSAIVLGASAPSTSLTTLTAPGPVAADPRGFVYVGDTSTGLITQVSPSGAVSTLAFALKTPAGLAVDALNNLYVSDSSAQAVYQLNPITGAVRTLAVGTLVAPAGLAIDPSGNLLITDPGAAAVYRFNLQSGVTTAVSSTAVAPSAIATDAAGNLLIADTASILAVPASANSTSFTVAGLVPSALTIDSGGNLYTGSGGSILKLTRTQGYVQFAGASAKPQTVDLLESGNQALLLSSIGQTDTADYNLATTASTDCALNGTLPSTLAVGGVCALTATYTPTTFVTTTDTATFNGNLANANLSMPALVQLTLTGPATPPTATIALGAFSPASPVYGQTVTVSATVSGSTVTPAGSVAFTVDGTTITIGLTSGVATDTLTGLSVGPHTVSATYTSSNGYTSATTLPVTLTVGQATATVTLSNLAQTYTGSPLSATAATTPAGLAVSLTYNGSATAPTNAGSYAVVATVNNPNYVGFASGTLIIAKAPTTTAFSANPANPLTGQSDLLTATVTGAGQLGGTVVFTSGATTLCTATLNASGVGACSFVPSKDGNLAVAAQYEGDANHLTSSTSLTLFVYDSAVKLQLSSTQLVYPGATNVTVCITPTSATGTVQIFDGTTLLTTLNVQGGGCAYWYISPGLSAGTHSLTAVYSGDKNNPSGTSVPVVVIVSPVPVKLTASCWNASFPYGGNYQCTVNLSSNAGAPLGSITYTFDGGSAVSVPLSSGNAQFTINEPNVGMHTVVIAYAQQTNYAAAASQTETFTVTAAPVNASLTPSTWYAKAGTSIAFQAAVSSWSAGPPNANGAVSFYDGGTLLSTVPVNASGQASYTTSSLSAGSNTITAMYAGGTNYASGSSSVNITLTQ